MTKIKIAMLPIDIRQADPAGNISQVKHLAGNLDKDTDIICLPELFTTGLSKTGKRHCVFPKTIMEPL